MRHKTASVLLVLISSGHGVQAVYQWVECKERVQRIRSGELAIGAINNETVQQFLYDGPVVGLDQSYPRNRYLAVTYEGCKAICGDPVAIYDAPKALGQATNWIFPLAILLSLPYESLHERKLSDTLAAVLNWLGSPQTALTATIFNFRQIRDCHRRTRRAGLNNQDSPLFSAAYYILCCLNQFDSLNLADSGRRPTRALNVLIYGLFRPLSGDQDLDVELTRQLLLSLAFQLRMLRRRGVIPTLASLGTFLVAFVFSMVLAFAELGDDNTPFSLAFGLLVSWLPLLVVFTIVDRNPVSSERTAELMSRWLFNVDAIATCHQRGGNMRNDIQWWHPRANRRQDLHVGQFIGQGRKIQYCGLPHAVLSASETVNFQDETVQGLQSCAERVALRLTGWKPAAWYVVSGLSLLLVWCAIMTAFAVSFTAPTVGLGCRTLTYLLFGGLSSLTWVIQFSKRPRSWAIWASGVFNSLAILTLLVAIVFQVTGIASNCFCKSSVLNRPLLGGYLDFESPAFYSEHFNVMQYWVAAASIGGSVPSVAFVVAVFWWLKCKHLWDANERRPENHLWRIEADLRWLM